MTKPLMLSQDLLSDFSCQPEQRRHVLISCVGDLEQISIELEKRGINIEGKMNELNILQASIAFNDLLKLQEMSNIEWVEIDEEVHVD
ncbi:MAG: hypothetical protein ACI8Z9_001565 [Paraglaciecola sp.]|jgi:hypothetical protein